MQATEDNFRIFTAILIMLHIKKFTVDLQIAAVLLCPACEDEIVSGLDLEVFSLILVLE